MSHTDGAVNPFGQPIGVPVTSWCPRAMPGETPLVGDAIIVRPLVADNLPGLFTATCTSAPERWTYMTEGPFDDVAGLAAYLRPLVDSPASRPMTLTTPTGEIVGTASFMRIDPTHGTVEVGSIMLSPGLARTRAATQAMTLMAAHVFEDLGYRRYEWKCDSLNEPSRRAALRLGFAFEGVWRNALVYKGRNRDTAWFAMTDDDWTVLAPLHRAWLDHTRDAPQQYSLSELTAARRS